MVIRIIVISTPIFACPPSGYSGLEFLAWQQAKGLAEKGHQVALVAPDGSTCPGCEIIATGPAGQVREPDAYNRYWQRLLDFNVVIDHSWQKFSYILKKEGKLKAPVLGVCHAPVDTMFRSPPPVPRACIVCISHDQKNHYEGLFSGKRAKVAHNGIDGQHYRSLPIKRSNRYLFLARFSRIKGADLAIEACKKAGVGLDLIGDTQITGEPDYLKQCQSMCDGKQIRMVGPATRGACVWWMSQAHAFLHPVRNFREPFGLAPIEANACGLPVIGWRNGALPETIKDGDTGFLVESVEEMTSIIKADKAASIDREACRTNALNFSVEKMIDRYEQLAQEAIATGGW